MAVEGWMYEHGSGERHWVAVEARGGSLILSSDTGTARTIDPARLYPVERRRQAEVYALRDKPGFRLGLPNIDDPMVEAQLPEFTIGRDEKRADGWLLWILLVVAVLTSAAGAFIPEGMFGSLPV